MDQIYIYSSRDEKYKSPFGAAAEGENVTFRILLHDEALCERAYMRLKADGDADYREIALEKSGQEGEYCWYVCSISLPEGIYWYHFAYDGGTGAYKITRFENGNGYLSPDGKDWQLTVYEKDFVTPDWLKGGIMYQIFPDRFAKAGEILRSFSDRVYNDNWGDEPLWRWSEELRRSGNYLGNDYFGGNLRGITEKLGYLKELGVTCIYLNPIFEAHSNHRYNTADYLKIDPTLGDDSDLEELCQGADGLGIHIILDGVFSHTGDDSIYFNKYGRYGSKGAYNSTDSDCYGWYKFENWPDKYHSWWGIDTLPEVEEDTPSFTDFICGENGVLRHWIKKGVSGWRLDVADELPDQFLDNVRDAIKAEDKNALLLGEVWEDATNKISYGARRRFLRGSQLDSVMNYPFRDAIIEFLTGGQSMHFLDAVMSVLENYPPQAVHCLMNHIGTHDTPRILTVLGNEPQNGHDRQWQSGRKMNEQQRAKAVRLLKIAAALQFTLPGVPCIYYGDEAGAEGYGDPFNRGCYPWGCENTELVEFYKRLGEIRRNSAVFACGEFIPVSGDAGHIAYIRRQGDEQILVAVNRWDDPAPLNVGDEWKDAEVLFGSSPIGGMLIIPGRGISMLKISAEPPEQEIMPERSGKATADNSTRDFDAAEK